MTGRAPWLLWSDSSAWLARYARILETLQGGIREAAARNRAGRELDLHLEMLADEFRQRGMDAPAARAAARREFGGIDPMKEVYRDGLGIQWIEILAKDVRYAIRGLRRSPAFTIAAVLSLALGIGANTAIFSFLDTLMLRMLPIEKPEQLLSLYRTGGWGSGYASYPQYLEFRRHAELFDGVLARSGAYKVRFDAGHENRADFVEREFVSGNYFDVLRVRPALGRVFTDADNRTPQGHSLAVLSYDFWRSRFGLDPGVLGRVLMVDEQALTVVGVAAPGFHGVEVEHRTNVWAPNMMFRGKIMEPGMHWVWKPMALLMTVAVLLVVGLAAFRACRARGLDRTRGSIEARIA